MISASAPGRVSLLGEHTDYNAGFALPVPLPISTRVELARRRDAEITGSTDAIVDDDWIRHVIAPARVLGLQTGYQVRVSSNVPPGAGLGSSGALAVAVLRALRDAFALSFDDVELARLAQRGERDVVGANVGIMDQLAASVGREGEALFLDCRTLAHERIPLPADMELVVIHSGVTHRHAARGPDGRSPYDRRRAECEEAARLLGVRELRDVGPGDAARIEALPEPQRRRARHVVSENARVLAAVEALRAGDAVALGQLVDQSHRSLRDDFEVSTPEVDLLVGLVREQEAVHGARITGGGFGGSIVAVADAGAGHSAAAIAVSEYEQRTGLDARIVLPRYAPEAL